MHRWGSILVLIPTGVIIASGIVLQFKKQSDWIAGPFAKLNFGLVRIDWSSTPVNVTLEAVGQDGKIGFSHSVSLDDLRSKAE